MALLMFSVQVNLLWTLASVKESRIEWNLRSEEVRSKELD